jgi:exopolyphosphatase/guanosine-5'-triphosphate,3'-diphosphate pyrophosphatase
VLARVKHETTVTLQELTGSEEASMTFFAVRRWYGWGAGPILNLDIGGGSFEMALGQDELPELATSVPLGASRLTRDWLHEDPPTAKSVKELRRYIRATLKPAVKSFNELGRANVVAGTSKTFRSLARIAGAAPSAAGPYVKRQLGATDLGIWAQRISAMKTEDRLHLPGVSEARANQLLAGALVAEAALELFEFKKVKICPWALREGLILRRLDQLIFEGPLEPASHVALPPVTAAPAAVTAQAAEIAEAVETAPAAAAAPATVSGGRAD